MSEARDSSTNLERLADLHRQGVLSEQEYVSAVARLVPRAEDPVPAAPSDAEPEHNPVPDGPRLDRKFIGSSAFFKTLIAGTVALVVIIAIAATTTRNPQASEITGSQSSAPDPGLVLIRQAIDQFNTDTFTNLAAAYPRLGAHNCGIGFSADFSELVLISLASSSGMWHQISVSPEDGVMPTSLKGGEDYISAGLDSAFFASAPYACTIDEEGQISLLGD